jgi:hypothetical protein
LFQAADAELAALAGISSAADRFPYFTGSGTASYIAIVAAIRTLLTSADVATFRTNAGLGTGDSPQLTGVNLGHATDTTLTRSAAGVLAVESVVIPSISSTNTLTNKRITKRVASATDDATAVIDCDAVDDYYLTAVANATEISVTGTPTAGQTIFIGLKDAGTSKALTWTGITGLGQTLPTATTAGKQHIIHIKYIASAWRAIAVSVEA